MLNLPSSDYCLRGLLFVSRQVNLDELAVGSACSPIDQPLRDKTAVCFLLYSLVMFSYTTYCSWRFIMQQKERNSCKMIYTQQLSIYHIQQLFFFSLSLLTSFFFICSLFVLCVLERCFSIVAFYLDQHYNMTNAIVYIIVFRHHLQ